MHCVALDQKVSQCNSCEDIHGDDDDDDNDGNEEEGAVRRG